MNHSENINELATALAKAQGEMKPAVKDSTNPHFRSKYADLASVWDACRDALSKHGLSVAQTTGTNDAGLVVVTTMLMHTSGQWITDSLTLPLDRPTPQAMGSAITYGRRYALSAMVGVSPDDDDAEAAENHAATQPKSNNSANRAAKQAGPKLDRSGIFEALKARGLSTDAISSIVPNWLKDNNAKTFNDCTLEQRRKLYDAIRRGEFDSFRPDEASQELERETASAAA